MKNEYRREVLLFQDTESNFLLSMDQEGWEVVGYHVTEQLGFSYLFKRRQVGPTNLHHSEQEGQFAETMQ